MLKQDTKVTYSQDGNTTFVRQRLLPDSTISLCLKWYVKRISLQDTEDSSLQIKVGDRVRCRSARPGYNESRVVEGIVEFIGKRRGYGKGLFVGVNLGVPRKYDVMYWL